jgi:hypothetical protein
MELKTETLYVRISPETKKLFVELCSDKEEAVAVALRRLVLAELHRVKGANKPPKTK